MKVKQRVGVVCGCTLLIALCAFAMLCPNRTFSYMVPEGEKRISLGYQQIDDKLNCEVSDDGTVTAVGEDVYLEFRDEIFDGECIQILAEGMSPITYVTLFFGKDGVYEAQDTQVLIVFSSETTICGEIPEGEFNSLRLAVNKPVYRLIGVDVYSEYTERQAMVQCSMKRYIAAGVITALGFFLTVFLEWKFKICDYIIRWINKVRKPTVQYAGIACIIGLVALLAEWVFTNLVGIEFRREMFFLNFTVIVCIFFMWYCRKEMTAKPEKIVLCITLATGLLIMLSIPPAHVSWDYDSHFQWVLKSSYLGTTYISEAEFKTMSYQFNWNDIDPSEVDIYYKDLSQLYYQLATVEDWSLYFPHVISGVVLSVARLLGAGFYGQYIFGIIPQLLIYSFVCYAAIKRIRSGKMLLSVIVLLPTNLFLAACYSYDYWVTAFSLLGTAYFIGMLQDSEKGFSLKDTFIMCFAYFLACVPKQIYFTLLILPFFMRKESFRKEDYRKYYRVCIMTVCLLIALFVLRSVTVIDSGGDLRGGSDVNTIAQIKYILSNPWMYIKTLFGFLGEYLSFSGIKGYATSFAYLGRRSSYWILGGLLLVTALTDKGNSDFFHGKYLLSVISVLFYVGTSVLLATAFYIAFTPVGSNVINGCQGRYLIPLLFPFLGLCFNPGRIKLAGKKWYYYVVLSTSMIVLLHNIYSLIIMKVA